MPVSFIAVVEGSLPDGEALAAALSMFRDFVLEKRIDALFLMAEKLN